MFKNAGCHTHTLTVTELPWGKSRVAVRLVATPKRVEDFLAKFELHR